jgi:hypothetical protein
MVSPAAREIFHRFSSIIASWQVSDYANGMTERCIFTEISIDRLLAKPARKSIKRADPL